MKKSPINTETFIEKAKHVHGDKYCYSKVEYVKANQKVIIICPEHGEFGQTPNEHINVRSGCPACGYIRTASSKALSTDIFIEQSKEVHGNKYDYSKGKATSSDYLPNSWGICTGSYGSYGWLWLSEMWKSLHH